MQIQLNVDQVLMNEGDPSDVLYLLLSGELAVYKYDPISKAHNKIGHVQPGELVGEMSFLDNLPRSATIKATTNCLLKMINRPAFNDMFKAQDPMMQNLVSTLSERLRKSNKKIHF
jgi:hypothetical protein